MTACLVSISLSRRVQLVLWFTYPCIKHKWLRLRCYYCLCKKKNYSLEGCLCELNDGVQMNFHFAQTDGVTQLPLVRRPFYDHTTFHWLCLIEWAFLVIWFVCVLLSCVIVSWLGNPHGAMTYFACQVKPRQIKPSSNAPCWLVEPPSHLVDIVQWTAQSFLQKMKFREWRKESLLQIMVLMVNILVEIALCGSGKRICIFDFESRQFQVIINASRCKRHNHSTRNHVHIQTIHRAIIFLN